MEAQHLGSPLIEPVHYFLGLLKVVDVDLDQVNSLRERGADAVDEITKDIGDLRLAFDRADVETTPLRRRLRSRLGKSADKKNGHLRRSPQSRTAFRFSEAFVKHGVVKPIHLLSILVEANILCVADLLRDLRLSRELLLETSTKIAISSSSQEKAEESSLANWERIFQSVTGQGWSFGWMRFIREDVLFWRFEASKAGIHHCRRRGHHRRYYRVGSRNLSMSVIHGPKSSRRHHHRLHHQLPPRSQSSPPFHNKTSLPKQTK